MSDKLPEMCATLHPTTREPVLIKRGVSGYFPFHEGDVDAFNARHGVTDEQKLAMEIGSMFGWDVPGANPDYKG